MKVKSGYLALRNAKAYDDANESHLSVKNKYRPGTVLDLRVTRVKEDGKMDVSDRQEAYLQINEDAENVLEIIEEFAGVLPFDDKASPEVIRREFGLSKNAFKRAVGHLLKEGKIQIKDRRIYLVK